ncbi:ATP-binding protein, partial [Candidatus Woesearchaeota archaeon]
FSNIHQQTDDNKKPYNIADLVSQIARSYEGKITYIQPKRPEETVVRCVPDFIDIVVRNLVSNALEAVQEKKQGESNPSDVILKLATAPEYVEISVEDKGTGIAEEKLHEIFLPDVSLKENHLGLGLYLVSEIVNAHGGSVHVASRYGQGSKFKILLKKEEGGAA